MRLKKNQQDTIRKTVREVFGPDSSAYVFGSRVDFCSMFFQPTANLIYRDFRAGDVRHSLADISKGKELPGYHPGHRIDEGLKEALEWYVGSLANS